MSLKWYSSKINKKHGIFTLTALQLVVFYFYEDGSRGVVVYNQLQTLNYYMVSTTSWSSSISIEEDITDICGTVVRLSTNIKVDLAYWRKYENCFPKKVNSPKPINHRLTLKEEPKVKSDHIKRFLAHDFL